MSKNKGWIKLHRKIQDSADYFDEPFCRKMAWVDMLLLANHDENTFRVRGIRVACKRGQIGFTSEKLASRWQWSRGKVLRFLKELQEDGMIVQQKNNVTTLISIINYGLYQDGDTADSITNRTTNNTTERQQTVQQTDINKNDKECIKNDKEEINRGEGDLAPLHASPQISGLHILPEGRSFIEPTIFFTKSDFNGLPEEKNKEIRNFLKVVKAITVESESISELWQSFKEMELTFQKPYRNKDDVYRHFLNWTKKQSFRKGAVIPKQKQKTRKDEKIHGVEFLNDFTECRMSDGTVYVMNRNERDAAVSNMINPKSIIKNA